MKMKMIVRKSQFRHAIERMIRNGEKLDEAFDFAYDMEEMNESNTAILKELEMEMLMEINDESNNINVKKGNDMENEDLILELIDAFEVLEEWVLENHQHDEHAMLLISDINDIRYNMNRNTKIELEKLMEGLSIEE